MKSKEGGAKPWVEVPSGEFNKLAWEIGLVRESRSKSVGQRNLARRDPDLPVYPLGAEGEVIARDAIHTRGANNSRTLQVLCQVVVRIAEEEWGEVHVNSGFLANTRKHFIKGTGSLGGGVNLRQRGGGCDRTSVVEEIEDMRIAAVDCA